ncbi:energy transducer TonB [Thalassotalea maritima]|uniref:energy transducer TonB n=1 Tax=Thalassotalea maritima TaxID=3242416 RepID=UPI003528AD33
MASLINRPEVYKEEPKQDTPVTVVNLPKDKDVARKQRQLEPPPKPVEKPSGMITLTVETPSTTTQAFSFDMPNIDINTTLDPQQFTLSVPKDNTAMPIYRALPIYPTDAAKNKIKGWVDLSFTVNTLGSIENIVVLDAEPPQVFEQAAIDALKRWKYKAKIVDGKAVKQEGLSVRINFGKK